MQRNRSALQRVLAMVLCVILGCSAFAGCSQVDDLVSGVTTGEFPVEVNGVTISSRPTKVVPFLPAWLM